MIIFTNGCFDVLHIGHLRLLQYCKSKGSVIVGINSDASVKRLKGHSRPINSQTDRRDLLLALSCVDQVVIFDEDTPLKLIRKIRPDLLIKGGDYKKEEVVGYGICEIEIFPLIKDKSSTLTIEKMVKSD